MGRDGKTEWTGGRHAPEFPVSAGIVFRCGFHAPPRAPARVKEQARRPRALYERLDRL